MNQGNIASSESYCDIQGHHFKVHAVKRKTEVHFVCKTFEKFAFCCLKLRSSSFLQQNLLQNVA